MQDLTNYEKRGYLYGDFRLFHLKDSSMERINWHFHDFHKMILFLSGHAAYCVEGKHYNLLPGDIVLVPQWTLEDAFGFGARGVICVQVGVVDTAGRHPVH